MWSGVWMVASVCLASCGARTLDSTSVSDVAQAALDARAGLDSRDGVSYTTPEVVADEIVLLQEGVSCSSHEDCLSGHCVDGLCCNESCSGVCESCSLLGARGVCTPIPEGEDPSSECPMCQVCDGTGGCEAAATDTDPKNECPQSAQDTCGLDGACDGAGSCGQRKGGTLCDAEDCVGVDYFPSRYCDGEGGCIASPVSCELLGWADGGASPQVCSSAGSCLGPATFAQAQQLCLQLGGRLCSWDEVEQGEAASAGCGIDSLRVWTLSECEEKSYWTGAGAPEYLMAMPKECTPAGELAYPVCCADRDTCCPFKCAGSGQCLATCGNNADCCEGYWCSAGACLLKSGIGWPCDNQDQCPDENCVDGRCCTSACAGACEACNLPGLEGQCQPFAEGTDPDMECSSCWACNGDGGCIPVLIGLDPKNDCAAFDASSCLGNGSCDGGGACDLWDAGTVCAALSCLDSTLDPEDYCSGEGHCVESGLQVSCCPYQCGEKACLTSCTTSSECCAGSACMQGKCVPSNT